MMRLIGQLWVWIPAKWQTLVVDIRNPSLRAASTASRIVSAVPPDGEIPETKLGEEMPLVPLTFISLGSGEPETPTQDLRLP